jgi:hypothetical protein
VHTPQNQTQNNKKDCKGVLGSITEEEEACDRKNFKNFTIFLVRKEEKTLHKTAPFLKFFNPTRFFLSTKTDHTSTKAPELESAVVAAVLLITVNTRDLQQKQGLRKKLDNPKKSRNCRRSNTIARRRKEKKKKLLLLLTCF